MDQSIKILKGSKKQVMHDLTIINAMLAAYGERGGYSTIYMLKGKAIIGKNANTGADNIQAAMVVWDEPRLLADGNWAIANPASDPRFANWKEALPDTSILQCIETDYVPAGDRDAAEKSGGFFNLKLAKDVFLSFFKRG